MSLFSRRSDDRPNPAPAGAVSQPRSKSFGHAAFDRADIDDARRGYPAVSLQPFATTAGLGYIGSELGAAFRPTLPAYPEYVFNVCRGVTPSGRLGQIAHELFEVAAESGKLRASGSFHHVRVTTHKPLLEMAGILVRDPLDQPFAANAVWIPTTTAHVRAPETNRLPMLKIARSGSFSGFGDKNLDKYGLPGYRIIRGKADDAVRTLPGWRPGQTPMSCSTSGTAWSPSQ
jgi:hypothetical protein